VKVILRETVTNVGEIGQTVKVADGYARNFLLPRKLAVQADSASAKQIEHELRIIKKREEKENVRLAEVAKALEQITVEIKAKAGEEDKIFGSVTTAQIVEKLREQGHEIDRKAIVLDEHIRTLGIYGAVVRLAANIEANVKVWVTKQEEAE